MQLRSGQYVCWSCWQQSLQAATILKTTKNGLQIAATGHPRWQATQKRFASTRRPPSGTTASYGRHLIPTAHSKAKDEPAQPASIRERLRAWALENDLPPSFIPGDNTLGTRTVNKMSRVQSTGFHELDDMGRDPVKSLVDSKLVTDDEDDHVPIVEETRNPGDLVELRTDAARAPTLAIYLGYIADRNHFYANNGRWIISAGFSPLFTVSNFASTAEVESILNKIPTGATVTQCEELRAQDRGPSREDGAPVIEKMTKFRLDSERIYQESLVKLDGALDLLADGKQPRYLSLFEIAEVLLPAALKSEGRFPTFVLYAVHNALMRADFGFHPLSPSKYCHRRDHIFEISSKSQLEIIHRVATITRAYTETRSMILRDPSPDDLAGTALGNFILKAREVVSKNRSDSRQDSSLSFSSSPLVTYDESEWSSSSKEIMSFLEWWSSYDLFDTASRYQAYGSIILGALNLYPNRRLDQDTAWIFLQEVGFIPSWEIPSRYKSRFPQVSIVRGGGLKRDSPGTIQESTRDDIASGARRDWGDSPVFCIDAQSTRVIDDGVSLERTSSPDQYWIHVHVADPASAIVPDSKLSKFLELVPQTIYLPGHFQDMLPADLGSDGQGTASSNHLVEHFSLRADGPVLTFSAKVDATGQVLDYRVEPGVIQNVKYLEPDDVSRFCKEPLPAAVPSDFLAVGQRPERNASKADRPIMATQELDNASKDDLTTLYRLAEAVRQRRLSIGAWPYFFPRPSVSVEFHDTPAEGATMELSTPVADPYIEVSFESSTGCSVVSNSMVLAGEIAAQWCSSRGIPVPYRRDVKQGDNFAQALAYATQEIYPGIAQGIEPPASQREELTRLTGQVELAASPGPYFLLGLNMYAKATSPLRRFSDLMVHWQIHAALAHERETGQPLDPKTDAMDDILPFSMSDLEERLPALETRERLCRTVARGTKDWMLQALKRDQFVEQKGPKTFRFHVDLRWRVGVIGHMDYFGLDALMPTSQINGLALAKDIDIGDEFEVAIEDVNIHSGLIFVKALSYLGNKAKGVEGTRDTAPANIDVSDALPKDTTIAQSSPS